MSGLSKKELEKQVQALEQALAQSRAALLDCKEKENQRKQLHRALAATTLISSISHHFNNILGIILGNTEMALNDLPQWDPARDWLAEIRTASLRAQGIVRQIQALSKTTDSKRPIHLTRMVEEALQQAADQLPAGVEIHHHLDLEPDIVMGNLVPLYSALVQVLTDAGLRIPDFRGNLRVSLEPVVVKADKTEPENAVAPGQYACLKIGSSGHDAAAAVERSSIAPDSETRLLHADKNNLSEDAVREIIRFHGGALTVAGTASEAASGPPDVKILLPTVDVCTAPAELRATEDTRKGTARILFVDDEIALVRLGKQMLSHYGYTVTTFVNPLNAIEAFRRHPDQFDLVITDLIMARMSGRELIDEMTKVRPDIPVIVCSGHSDLIDSEITDQPAVKAFLAKPIRMIELNNKIREVFAEKLL